MVYSIFEEKYCVSNGALPFSIILYHHPLPINLNCRKSRFVLYVVSGSSPVVAYMMATGDLYGH
jgi:hypothetical protein